MFSGSDIADEVAWYKINSNNDIHKVGGKKANELSIHDLSGNISEWCFDWYKSDYYELEENKNPKGPKKGDFKVHRGGSWFNTEKMISITNRRASKPRSQKATIGFRVVKDVD